MEHIKEWYYVINDQKYGPVSGNDLHQMYHNNVVNYNTLVWKPGLFEWIPLSQARNLDDYLHSHPPIVKPTNDYFVWIVAFMPLIPSVIITFLEVNMFYLLYLFLILGINIALCLSDEYLLRKAGYDTKELIAWAILLIPVYLFRRAYLSNKKYGYAIAWIITFSICFL